MNKPQNDKPAKGVKVPVIMIAIGKAKKGPSGSKPK